MQHAAEHFTEHIEIDNTEIMKIQNYTSRIPCVLQINDWKVYLWTTNMEKKTVRTGNERKSNDEG